MITDIDELPDVSTYYPMSIYTILGNEVSHLPYKKYNLVLQRKGTNTIIRVPYGDSQYPQYRDTTGIGKYTHRDHLDKNRQIRYLKRHRVFLKRGYYSPGWASLRYLWT